MQHGNICNKMSVSALSSRFLLVAHLESEAQQIDNEGVIHMKKLLIIILGLITILSLTLPIMAVIDTVTPQTICDTDTLRIVRRGAEIAVYDLVGSKAYTFHTVRTKRGNGRTEPITTVSTSTIKIELLPHGAISITDYTSKKSYIIKRRIFGGF